MTVTAYKVLTADQWAQFERDAVFCGAPVDLADGYIHLSTAEQLAETLAKHFFGQTGLVVAECRRLLTNTCAGIRCAPLRCRCRIRM